MQVRLQRLVVAAAAFACAVAIGASTAASGARLESAPGGDAIALKHTRTGVTLKIVDERATAAEMNREIAAAGIERVRVITIPGSADHAGTWAGTINMIARCEGAPSRSGYGVRIAFHPDNGVPAPSRHVVDFTFPQSRRTVVGATLILQRGAGKRAVISTRDLDPAVYTPAVLIAITQRHLYMDDTAKDFGSKQLLDLGGLFAPYGEALADGHGRCRELGYSPL
jgi:hypothetical protein